MKMAIVGCEASGKTVFMCALADYFGLDAAKNSPQRLRLIPENPAANSFERFQFRQMRSLREWPPVTAPEQTVEMKWSLRSNGEVVANVDMLEFGGEVYRAAFRGEATDPEKQDKSVQELMKYLTDSDFFVVLVSIKAILSVTKKLSDEDFARESEALWVTRGILDFIRKNRPNANVVIGLTQADKYRSEIGEAGGPRQFFAEYWPTVAATIGDIPVVDVASVSKTDENGKPAEGYRTNGILPVMRIFSKYCFGSEDTLENGTLIQHTEGAATETVSAAVPPRTNPLATPSAKPSRAPEVIAPAAPQKKPRSSLVAAIILLGLGALAGIVCWNASTVAPSQQPTVTKTVTNTVEAVVEKVVEKVVEVKVPVTNVVEETVEVEVQVPVTNIVEKVVEKVVEKKVEVQVPVTNIVEQKVEVQVPVTNIVEQKVEVQVPVTNIVEQKVEIEVPVTNVIEKVIEKYVTNTIEETVEVEVEVPVHVTNAIPKTFEVPITNYIEKVVEKVVEVPVSVTNTVEKVIEKVVEKVVTNAVGPAVQPIPVTMPSNTLAQAQAELQKQVPPGYRIWTDYNGRKIIAKWKGVAVDESGITIVTRYNRRIDAVLWKFSPEDQAYIKEEIRRHTNRGEVMYDGKWVRDPMLKIR